MPVKKTTRDGFEEFLYLLTTETESIPGHRVPNGKLCIVTGVNAEYILATSTTGRAYAKHIGKLAVKPEFSYLIFLDGTHIESPEHVRVRVLGSSEAVTLICR